MGPPTVTRYVYCPPPNSSAASLIADESQIHPSTTKIFPATGRLIARKSCIVNANASDDVRAARPIRPNRQDDLKTEYFKGSLGSRVEGEASSLLTSRTLRRPHIFP